LTAVAPLRKARALELFAGIPAEHDAVGALLSFGQDPRWRRTLVAAVAVAPRDRVLDVAKGTGLVAAALIERHRC
jgi:demethylmenaquinone methyltransferase / 2-methoxy-6-polyprenyl-1,4-benzoquinol methylase